MSILHRLASFLTLAAALVAAAGAQTRFNVTSVGAVAQLAMQRIANNGLAFGRNGAYTFAWTPALGAFPLPDVQGNMTVGSVFGYDVNSSGMVVGYCDTDVGGGHYVRFAFSWTQSGGTVLFQDFPGNSDEAYGVNDIGHIAGRYWTPDGQGDSYLWRAPGDYTVLPRLVQTKGTQPVAVNDADCVVGYAGIEPSGARAVLWKPGQNPVDIGIPPGQTQTDPVDVNDNGNVATVTFGQLGTTVGFVWYSDGTWVQVLNPVWPGAQTYPRSMNDTDAVVGDLIASQGVYKAFVWTPGKGTRVVDDMLDPSAAGWSIKYLGGINDQGQMCGWGTFQGQQYGVVLDPVLVQVAPSSLTVSLGKKDAGSVASLGSVDGDVLRVCKFLVPNLTVAPVDVKIDGTFTSGNCLGITLRVVSRMQQAGAFSQTLNLWDWTTGDWDAKDVRVDPVSSTFVARELVADGDTRRLLKSDGSLRARYRVKQTGPAATVIWCHEVDQAVWLVAP